MKNSNAKYIIFHVLTALYFIWLLVLISLIAIGFYYKFIVDDDSFLTSIISTLFINLIMGALLTFTLRLLANNQKIVRFVKVSYYIVMLISIVFILAAYLM